MTYVVGTGNNTATTIYTGSNNNSLANLLTSINGQTGNAGVPASTANGVLTLTSGTAQTGDNITPVQRHPDQCDQFARSLQPD